MREYNQSFTAKTISGYTIVAKHGYGRMTGTFSIFRERLNQCPQTTRVILLPMRIDKLKLTAL